MSESLLIHESPKWILRAIALSMTSGGGVNLFGLPRFGVAESCNDEFGSVIVALDKFVGFQTRNCEIRLIVY